LILIESPLLTIFRANIYMEITHSKKRTWTTQFCNEWHKKDHL